jgi:hypothetical protein
MMSRPESEMMRSRPESEMMRNRPESEMMRNRPMTRTESEIMRNRPMTQTESEIMRNRLMNMSKNKMMNQNNNNLDNNNLDNNNLDNVFIEDINNRGGNTYDVNSVEYQQDGLQNKEGEQVLDNNLFRMSVGNRSVVNKFVESGGKYYGDILTRSTNAPSKFQAATNELKYGDFNYIAPLNKGMINPEYTFVSPTNWYPIPPHPPVCVTNKSCTTCPIIMGDGKDYMQFASLEDFDKSRRFTGDMGINIDYIKNILNNANGY